MGLLTSIKLRHLIEQAQKGDELSRERLIQDHRKFVAEVCSHVCNRFLAWENDEELSVGLLAFNEAIDAYDTRGKVEFTIFAHTVIKRRLIDYFRSQAKYENEFLTTPQKGTDELEAAIDAKAISLYAERTAQENLADLIELYKMKLSEYGININELPKVSPKHRDTRESLIKVALILVEDQAMVNYLRRYRQLPIKNLCQATGLSRKVLEKGRKYVIALAIMLIEPMLAPLKKFANLPDVRREYGHEK